MPGLYDRLTNRLGDDDDDQPTGFTPFDLMDLPDNQRRVLAALLRTTPSESGGVTLNILQEKLDDVEDLTDTLAELARNQWLIVLGEPPDQSYKANVRRKRGSQLTHNVWSSLADRLTDEGEDPDQTTRQKPSMSDW
jgi:hypothetical protein